MTPDRLDQSLLVATHDVVSTSPWLQELAIGTANWAILALPLIVATLWLTGGTQARQTSVVATLSAAVALSFAGVLSFAFYEPRPFTLGLAANVLDHTADSSFPSDHVAVMTAVAVSLLLGGQRGWGLLTLAATLAVGAARVAVGVHFPGDILAGMVVGTLAAAAFRMGPLQDFAAFCRSILFALSSLLGIESAANRLKLQKHLEINK